MLTKTFYHKIHDTLRFVDRVDNSELMLNGGEKGEYKIEIFRIYKQNISQLEMEENRKVYVP